MSAMSRSGIARRACFAAALLLVVCALPVALAEDAATSDSLSARAVRDLRDPCTDVDVFAVFPRHLHGASTRARFDLRALNATALGPGGGNLGYIEGESSPDHDTKVTASFCLPRGTGFFLIASGTATRGSSFGRFTITVTSREYYNMTLFSAGSEWTRGAAYDTNDPQVALGDGALSEFLQDRGIGPPLWDTKDAGHVYDLHGRARFDTWGRNPASLAGIAQTKQEIEEADAFYAQCGALVAVFVGCSPYGNGAVPGDMSYAIVPAGETDFKNAIAQVNGDAFQWGASVSHVVCLPAGEYDVIARDAGNTGRGWGYGVSMEVLELEMTDGEYFHGYPLNTESEDLGWFTAGHSATLRIKPEGHTRNTETAVSVAQLGSVRVVRSVAKNVSPRRALLDTTTVGSSEATENPSVSLITRAAASTALVALVVAAVASALSPRTGSQQEDLNALLKQRPGSGSVADRARLLRSRKEGAYGASAFDAAPVVTARDTTHITHTTRSRISRSALVVAAAAGVVATASVVGNDGVFTFNSRARLGSSFSRLGLAEANMCGMGIPGCSVLEPPECAGRAYTYKPGMLAHLQGGVGHATALAASAEWTEAERVNTYALSADASNEHSLIDVNHGLCDIVERIEGTNGIDWSEANVDWSDPTSSLGGKGKGQSKKQKAKLGSAQSGCVNDVGGHEHVTLEFCREACRRDDGCVSYHAFRTVTGSELSLEFDASRNEDTHADYTCKMCGAGGEGAFTPEVMTVDETVEATVDSVRGPAWCLTEHRLTFLTDKVEQCARACDATHACDAFNFGVNHGDCLLLHLGANATGGAIWRGSAGSKAGVAGYATYYAKSPLSIQQATEASDAVSAADAAAQTVLAPSRADRMCAPASATAVAAVGAAKVAALGNTTDEVTIVTDFTARAIDETAGEIADTSSLTVSSTATETTDDVKVIVLDTAGDRARRWTPPPPVSPPTPDWPGTSDVTTATVSTSTSATTTASATTSSSDPTPHPTPAATSSTDVDGAHSASPTPAATPVIEQSGSSENVDAAQDIETILDEPVSGSESDVLSGDDGVTTPEETTEGVVEHAVHEASDAVEDAGDSVIDALDSAGHLVQHGAEDAGDSVQDALDHAGHLLAHGTHDAGDAAEDAGDSVIDTLNSAGHSTQHGLDSAGHSVQHGAQDAGDAVQDALTSAGHSAQHGAENTGEALADASAAVEHVAVNAVDGVMSAVDGAWDQLTHADGGDSNEELTDADTDDDGELEFTSDAFDANSFEEPGDDEETEEIIEATADNESTEPSDESSNSEETSQTESSTTSSSSTSESFHVNQASPADADPVEGTVSAEEQAEAERRQEAEFDPSGTSPPPESTGTPPPPAPIFIPDVIPTIMETCDTCKTPPCHLFEEDVKETDFIVHAESCCQALRGWKYGNTANFPHMCGECAEQKERMTYSKALHHCSQVGGGLCANNQVTAGTRTPGCLIEPEEEVWTSEACSEHDEGRFVMAAGGGGRRCEVDLDLSKDVVCCANTCNTFIPDHMCPSSTKQEFWQASAEATATAGVGAAAEAAMGAPRRRDPNIHVPLPDLPGVKKAKQQVKGSELGKPFKAAALGDAAKETVLAAAREAMKGETSAKSYL